MTSAPAASLSAQSVHIRRSWRPLFATAAEAEAFARLFAESQALREGVLTGARPARNVAGGTADTARFDLVPLKGHTLLVRPGTTDAEVLDDTFVGLYHLPPVELPAGARILDLGGNAGYTAAHFATLYERAQVACVEMDAGNAAIARANLARFGTRCRVIEAAAWSSDGTIEFAGTEAWGLRVSGLEGETPTPAGDRRVRCRAATVETILRELGWDGVDYAKIDIEGAEAEVITRGAAWLRRVKSLKVEWHAPATAESMAAVLQVMGFAARPDEKHPRCVVGVR